MDVEEPLNLNEKKTSLTFQNTKTNKSACGSRAVEKVQIQRSWLKCSCGDTEGL